MNPLLINKLIKSKYFQEERLEPTIKETHISWLILSGDYAYKIKKPVRFTFLDFSTLKKRKYYCEREVILNRRLADEMYLKVIPIYRNGDSISFTEREGKIIDYAVKMKRMDSSKEMKLVLEKNEVRTDDIINLAKQVAAFHGSALVIKNKFEIAEFRKKYNDISIINNYISKHYGTSFINIIKRLIEKSDKFLGIHQNYFQFRSAHGCIRDVHGDLHSGNIFLYEDPVIFDCIEFNDDLRQIDILDEAAFFCMDMEANRRPDLGKLFYENYLIYSKIGETRESRILFNYYKSYRANVRAKVYTLDAIQSNDKNEDEGKEREIKRYFSLLEAYLGQDQYN